MSYLMLFHGNNGYVNAPQSYICIYIACLVDVSVVLNVCKPLLHKDCN